MLMLRQGRKLFSVSTALVPNPKKYALYGCGLDGHEMQRIDSSTLNKVAYFSDTLEFQVALKSCLQLIVNNLFIKW